jgi:hypothetical protein
VDKKQPRGLQAAAPQRILGKDIGVERVRTKLISFRMQHGVDGKSFNGENLR